MFVDRYRKAITEKTPNICKMVRIFFNRLGKVESNDSFCGTYRAIELSPSIFGQKNLTKGEAKKLHLIVLEAFEHLCDPKEKEDLKYLNFKRFRKNLKSFSARIRGDKHFIIKDKENNIAGFYQYALKSHSLYIQSLVIPKELRHTNKAPIILKIAVNNMLKTAKKLKYDKITLHVEARNKALTKSYERFGFKIKKKKKTSF